MVYLIGAGFVVLVVLQHAFRRGRAKAAAEQWLRQHHYRQTSLRTPWFRTMGFATSWLRDSGNAFDFEATVADTQLRGTGTIFLRVWTNWLGEITDEVEVVWDEMPEGGGSHRPLPLWERLADAQLVVLQRVAQGETALYAPRNPGESGENFSELIEHVLALSRRGMLTSGEPRVGNRNTNQYVSIDNLSLTEEGRRWLESAR